MPNHHFKFKKFNISQDQTSMKVSSDAVLFGSWPKTGNARRILDIGTGTGLLSLMLAQKNELAIIDAVEIDNNAFMQAQENFKNSLWAKRLHVFHCSWQNFWPKVSCKYDLIISNPPFFKDALLNNSKKRAIARHQLELTFKELIYGAENLLDKNGSIFILVPFTYAEELVSIGENYGLFNSSILKVKQKANKPYSRAIVCFTRFKNILKEASLTVLDDNGEYSSDFISLTKDFYLYM